MNKRNIQIFLISLAMLFLEIMLIRWISTESRIFSYLNNLVLLACFLGMGLGCLLSKKEPDISRAFLTLAFLVAIMSMPLYIPLDGRRVHLFREIPLLLSKFTDQSIWYTPKFGFSMAINALAGTAATFILFFMTAVTFFPFGQMLGRALDGSKDAILAYSINIIGSLAGMWLFTALSFINTPPWFWLAVFSMISIALLITKGERSVKAWLALTLVVVISSFGFINASTKSDIVLWSPYQKLEVRPVSDGADGYSIRVNGVSYMSAQNLSEEFLKKRYDPLIYKNAKFSHYNIPYLFKPRAEDVLILGAGAGNDAAGAMRNGAGNVDVVEIDPVIYEIGLLLHPEKPYRDPRVHIFIDDARSYLKRSGRKYDLISFGLLDSHTPSSSYNNVRLDHYVYTEESFREAKGLLKEGGVLTVAFQPNHAWLAARIYKILDKVFGSPPLYFKLESDYMLGFGGVVFVAGDKNIIDAVSRDSLNGERFLKIPSESTKKIFEEPLKLSTDNWPYLYLKAPAIPKMHLLVMAALLIVSALIYRRALMAKYSISYHFFFLGAAFMLLEFTNISKSALIFGSTWQVNTIIISAMLILALFANLAIARFRVDNRLVYAMLIASVLAAFFLPLSALNNISGAGKGLIASAVLNLPVFFAGMIFAMSFKNTACKDRAFGSNIFGAAAGGLLESFSFIFGINMILLMVGGLYCLSLIFLRDA